MARSATGTRAIPRLLLVSLPIVLPALARVPAIGDDEVAGSAPRPIPTAPVG